MTILSQNPKSSDYEKVIIFMQCGYNGYGFNKLDRNRKQFK